jgi:hypothetical protein
MLQQILVLLAANAVVVLALMTGRLRRRRADRGPDRRYPALPACIARAHGFVPTPPRRIEERGS